MKGSRPGRRRGGTDYQIVFKSEFERATNRIHYVRAEHERELTSDQLRKAARAKVMLVIAAGVTGYLGSPTLWTAPNGVTVFYNKGQRRSKGGSAVYHDFSASEESVIPLTRNIGAGRRALRAWAAKHLVATPTARFQARQMVRPGD